MKKVDEIGGISEKNMKDVIIWSNTSKYIIKDWKFSIKQGNCDLGLKNKI